MPAPAPKKTERVVSPFEFEESGDDAEVPPSGDDEMASADVEDEKHGMYSTACVRRINVRQDEMYCVGY